MSAPTRSPAARARQRLPVPRRPRRLGGPGLAALETIRQVHISAADRVEADKEAGRPSSTPVGGIGTATLAPDTSAQVDSGLIPR